jgi:hypothetical protein
VRRGKTVPISRSRSSSSGGTVSAASVPVAVAYVIPSMMLPQSSSSGGTMREQRVDDNGLSQRDESVAQKPSYMLVPSVRGPSQANLALGELPRRVLTAILSCLSVADVVSLACSCKALRSSCYPLSSMADKPGPVFPPATHAQTDVAAVASRMRVGVSAENHLAALRVLLTQATRFPRVRLTSASFVGCGPHARDLLEACG